MAHMRADEQARSTRRAAGSGIARDHGATRTVPRRRSEPATHSPRIAPPFVTEVSLQLGFLAANESIYQRQVCRGNEQRRRRSKQQRRSEKDEDVAAKIQRIPRKAIWARGNEGRLWFERDYAHVVNIEMERRPEAHEKSEPQKEHGRGRREGRAEGGKAEKRVKHSAQVRDTETYDDDAGVVEGAL